MAKVFSPPEELGEVPEFVSFTAFGQYERDSEQWLGKLVEWCRTHGSGEYAGEVVRYPVADGYAQYVVFKMRPLSLIHAPINDARLFQYAKNWTAKDIEQLVTRERAVRSNGNKRGQLDE